MYANSTSIYYGTNNLKGGGSIGTLIDVTISNLQNNQILKYNGSAWVNAAEGGGGSGSVTEDTVIALKIDGIKYGVHLEIFIKKYGFIKYCNLQSRCF